MLISPELEQNFCFDSGLFFWEISASVWGFFVGKFQAMAMRKKIDWASIEPAYRAGIQSVIQIAADYEKRTGDSISHTAIIKHFRKLGVTRDLSGKVQSKADYLVSASLVSAKVSAETFKADADIINANAEVVAAIRIEHRNDIKRIREFEEKLLTELETSPQKNYVAQYKGVVVTQSFSLTVTEKAATLQSLAIVRERRIALERREYGMDKVIQPQQPNQYAGIPDAIMEMIKISDNQD